MDINTINLELPKEQIVTTRALGFTDFIIWMIPYVIAIYLYYKNKDKLSEQKLKVLKWIIYLWPVFASIMLILQIYLFKVSNVQ